MEREETLPRGKAQGSSAVLQALDLKVTAPRVCTRLAPTRDLDPDPAHVPDAKIGKPQASDK